MAYEDPASAESQTRTIAELVDLVRLEVHRLKPGHPAAYAWFTVLRLPDGSGDWLVQARFDVPNAYLTVLHAAGQVVRRRFTLAPLPFDEGEHDE